MPSSGIARGAVQVFALWLLAPLSGAAQEGHPLPEGNAYVRSVLRDALPQDTAINDYAYDVLESRETLNRDGSVRSRETRRFEVYFVKTRPVRRLVAKNGTPLGPREQNDEDRRAEAQARAIAEGRTVSERPGIRLGSLLDRFDFGVASREAREGRDTLVFGFEPRPGAAAGSSGDAGDRVTRILSGRISIDEAERRVARVEAWNTPGRDAKVSTGVKVGSLSTLMDFTRVAERVWLPREVRTEATARVFFFRTVRVRNTTVYSNYRRFEVDTEERPASSATPTPQPFF